MGTEYPQNWSGTIHQIPRRIAYLFSSFGKAVQVSTTTSNTVILAWIRQGVVPIESLWAFIGQSVLNRPKPFHNRLRFDTAPPKKAFSPNIAYCHMCTPKFSKFWPNYPIYCSISSYSMQGKELKLCFGQHLRHGRQARCDRAIGSELWPFTRFIAVWHYVDFYVKNVLTDCSTAFLKVDNPISWSEMVGVTRPHLM